MTTYTFTVRCKDSAVVVEWGVGDIDPGKEFLRASTGTKYPGCTVGDYNETTDYTLPKEHHSHEGGVIAGIPFLSSILRKIFGW